MGHAVKIKNPFISGCVSILFWVGTIVGGIWGLAVSDLQLWLKLLILLLIIVILFFIISGLIILLKEKEGYTKWGKIIHKIDKWILYIILGVPIICLSLCIVGTFVFLTIKAILNLFGIDIYTLWPFVI